MHCLKIGDLVTLKETIGTERPFICKITKLKPWRHDCYFANGYYFANEILGIELQVVKNPIRKYCFNGLSSEAPNLGDNIWRCYRANGKTITDQHSHEVWVRV